MTCIMNISRLWLFLGALVSSNAFNLLSERCTDVSINASLSSQALLPCQFNKTHNETVTWSHLQNGDTLLKLYADGRIYFNSLREGRVNVYPLLFNQGNFSILIHNLEVSDFGIYICKLDSECWRVKVTKSHQSQEVYDLKPLFYFTAGAGLFMLLFIVFSLFSKLSDKYRSSNPSASNGVHSEGTNHTEETKNTQSRGHENNNRGLRRGSTVVYENDVGASNPSPSVQQTQHPQRAFRPLPEPSSQPTDVMPYYVNQVEISMPSNTGKHRKKKKPAYQFKNPIYGE